MTKKHVGGGNTYFQNHIGYKKRNNINEKNIHTQYDFEIYHEFPTNKEIKVLDLGYGQGYFANYIKKLGYIYYTGIDIDNTYKKEIESILPTYEFIHQNVFNFFKENHSEYDLIFSSNIFEHLGQEERILWINEVSKKLTKDGIRINYMPNADSIFGSTGARYTDITHYTIYNTISFSQLLNQYGNFSSIQHINQYIGTNIVKRFLHRTILSLYKVIYTLLGFTFPPIYTGQIITFCKK